MCISFLMIEFFRYEKIGAIPILASIEEDRRYVNRRLLVSEGVEGVDAGGLAGREDAGREADSGSEQDDG